MTWRIKIKIMITVTLLMGFGMMLAKSIFIPCNILFCVWVFHILYFIFGVKKYKPKKKLKPSNRKTAIAKFIPNG